MLCIITVHPVKFHGQVQNPSGLNWFEPALCTLTLNKLARGFALSTTMLLSYNIKITQVLCTRVETNSEDLTTFIMP